MIRSTVDEGGRSSTLKVIISANNSLEPFLVALMSKINEFCLIMTLVQLIFKREVKIPDGVNQKTLSVEAIKDKKCLILRCNKVQWIAWIIKNESYYLGYNYRCSKHINKVIPVNHSRLNRSVHQLNQLLSICMHMKYLFFQLNIITLRYSTFIELRTINYGPYYMIQNCISSNH